MKDKLFTFDDMNKLARYITDNFNINSWTNTRIGDKSEKNVPTGEIVNEFIGLLLQTSEDRTSEKWQELYPEVTILDPDGWDRKNFTYSYHEEKISFEEYCKRLERSTCKGINNYPLKIKH